MMKIPRTPLEHLEYGHRYRVEGIKHLEEALRSPELSWEKIREQRKADLCIAIADSTVTYILRHTIVTVRRIWGLFCPEYHG